MGNPNPGLLPSAPRSALREDPFGPAAAIHFPPPRRCCPTPRLRPDPVPPADPPAHPGAPARHLPSPGCTRAGRDGAGGCTLHPRPPATCRHLTTCHVLSQPSPCVNPRVTVRVACGEPPSRLRPREAGEHAERTAPERRPEGPELRGSRDVRRGVPRRPAPASNARTLRHPLELSVPGREGPVGKQPGANGRPLATTHSTCSHGLR